jgi:hypothetical protein
MAIVCELQSALCDAEVGVDVVARWRCSIHEV